MFNRHFPGDSDVHPWLRTMAILTCCQRYYLQLGTNPKNQDPLSEFTKTSTGHCDREKEEGQKCQGTEKFKSGPP